MIVVSDTSPLANLIQIGRLDLLRLLYEQILIPPTVHQEIVALESFGVDLSVFQTADWIVRRAPTQEFILLPTKLDAGESEAIALAHEVGADWILMDERAGTRIAEQHGLRPVGLLGVLIRAKQARLIAEVMPVVEELKTKAGFWVSDRLLDVLRRLVHE